MLITAVSSLLIVALIYVQFRWYYGTVKSHDRIAAEKIAEANEYGPLNKDFVAKEETVRKDWLISYLCILITTYSLLAYTVSKYSDEYYDLFDNLNYALFVLVSALLVSIICFVSFEMNRYFCYKRRGTKWLMFLLVSAIISALYAPYDLYQSYGSEDFLSSVMQFSICEIACTYFFYNTFKLYKVNVKRKKHLRAPKPQLA